MSARLISKHASGSKKGGFVQYYDVDATSKWVEYMLDKQEANKVLMHVDFTTKMNLLEILDVLDRKIDYMYKHKNFNFTQATRLFHLLKNAPLVTEVVAKKQQKKR